MGYRYGYLLGDSWVPALVWHWYLSHGARYSGKVEIPLGRDWCRQRRSLYGGTTEVPRGGHRNISSILITSLAGSGLK